MKNINIGIDLGTTNSAIAKMENGKPMIVTTGRADIVPSCVAIQNGGRILVGDRAKIIYAQEQEKELLEYGTQRLLEIEGLKIFGTATTKTSVISFNIEGIHPYDIGTIIDKLGIAVRTGHHCAQPVMNFFNIPGTIRASFAFYNTKEEIDLMVEAVKKAKLMLS